jgi:hypothetical protein
MGEVEEDGAAMRLRPWKPQDIVRRGNQLRLTLARIELAMDGLIAVDRLLVLNATLENVSSNAAGRR